MISVAFTSTIFSFELKIRIYYVSITITSEGFPAWIGWTGCKNEFWNKWYELSYVNWYMTMGKYVNICEYEKIWIRKNSVFGHFSHSVKQGKIMKLVFRQRSKIKYKTLFF